jgi:hypothetical protein
MKPNKVDVTRFGWLWGNVYIERLTTDERAGWYLRVWGRRDNGKLEDYVDIRVTPTGKLVKVLER